METLAFRWNAFSHFRKWLIGYFDRFIDYDDPRSEGSEFYKELLSDIEHTRRYEELDSVLTQKGFRPVMFFMRWVGEDGTVWDSFKSALVRYVQKEVPDAEEARLNALREASKWYEIVSILREIGLPQWEDYDETGYFRYVFLPKWFMAE